MFNHLPNILEISSQFDHWDMDYISAYFEMINLLSFWVGWKSCEVVNCISTFFKMIKMMTFWIGHKSELSQL